MARGVIDPTGWLTPSQPERPIAEYRGPAVVLKRTPPKPSPKAMRRPADKAMRRPFDK